MIEIKNVSKKFNNEYVLKKVTFSLPNFGLVVINGPSGCGKTTLLNIISTLLPFDGDVLFDGKQYSKLSDNDKEEIRSKKIGFIFQDYKLFEFETVKQNIGLALDISCGETTEKKNKRIKDLLRLINLSRKENELVSLLSGGEKQRVAIARAIANNPQVILADEPTGNLDEYNSKIVMELIQKISFNSLVVMVSHDNKLSQEYGDQIIQMEDGVVKDIAYQNKKKHHQSLPVISLKHKIKSRLLPFSFLLRHTLESIKRKKWRTLITTFITSIGLIGIGLASTLSSIVSENLYRSYSSILDDDRLIISPKDSNNEKDIISSASFDEVNELAKPYSNNIKYIGVYYLNDFNQMFDYNISSLEKGGTIKPLNGINISCINEFSLLKNNLGIIPESIDNLANNEFVLAGPFSIVNELCYQLQIDRTLESFRRYLLHNVVEISFYVANSLWQYEGGFTLTLKGFVLSNKVQIYHSNYLWNEYIFENKLTLPTSTLLNVASQHPWDLRKGYYFDFNNGRDEFIKSHRFDFNYKGFDFEILDQKYYPNLCLEYEPYECSRVLAIKRTKKDFIPSFIGGYCKDISKHIKNVIYGSSNAYAIYDKNLMTGFAKNSYLSSSELEIEDIIDLLSYIKYEESQKVVIPDGTIEGHFTKANTDGFSFDPNYSLIRGRHPVNYHEIVVSNSLLEKLKIVDPINKSIYFTFPIIENYLPSGYISREFKTIPLKIVGVSNSGKYSLHHDESWSILFFQTMLGLSTLQLNVENISIQIDKQYEEDIVARLNRSFPQYDVSSPLKDVRKSVDQICYYIELILLIVSISSIIIASLILIICNHLHFIEAKRDIGLVRCLGCKKSESKKFVYFHSFVMTGFSLLLSSIELLFISIVLSKTLADSLQIQSQFIINPLSFLYMFLVNIVISIVSSFFISKEISKISPLECLS